MQVLSPASTLAYTLRQTKNWKNNPSNLKLVKICFIYL